MFSLKLVTRLNINLWCRRNLASTPPKISAAPSPPHKNITIHSLLLKKRKGIPISMVTAYDFPSAVHVDKAGVDILLVGDSVGMVELGYETTLPVTLDDMVHHCKAVCRGCRRPLIVGDLPFGTYERSADQAITSAMRLMKETQIDCIKLEGPRIETIKAIVESGIAVMGHIGLTPQSFSALGGFKAQGRDAHKAVLLIEQAVALEKAGCFGMVIECVPPLVAKAVTEAVTIPVIGIGAGGYTDGQVLVFHDMLGMMQHHHHAEFTPQFCKQYASVGFTIQEGLAQYIREVESKEFPGDEFSPYIMSSEEESIFKDLLEKRVANPKSAIHNSEEEVNIKVY